LLKEAGIFGDLEINATEFTPTDVTELKIYESEAVLPQMCVEADPTLPYCQIAGQYRLDQPVYNEVEPYSHMNERCSRVWPEYKRSPATC